MNPEREERQKRHMRELHEFNLAELRDDIVEYEQDIAAAAVRGNEFERQMWEEKLAETRARLARAEARKLPV
ncbi:MAG: hypothetical protein GEV12_02725 [Micromonosporaceae bacterium]|nr:hypothetical protein [Micromonosporaceae bacterium]